MMVSWAALALLLFTGTATRAFVPTALVLSRTIQNRHESTRLFAQQEQPKFPSPKVTSDTPIATDSQYLKNIMEARYCLLEIETAADKAREYLEYMEDVSVVIRQYLGHGDNEATTTTPLFVLPANVKDAHEYLDNIEKATASALEYLQYLEDMAVDIKVYLHSFSQEYNKGSALDEHAQKAQEAKQYFDQLEETAASARDYLTSLQDVATVVEGYLEKLNIQKMPELGPVRATRVLQPQELPPVAPLEQVVVVEPMTSSTKRVEPAASAVPTTKTSSGSYLDSIASMDSIASSKRGSGSGPRGYLDSFAPSTTTTTTTGTTGPRGYLDNINNNTPPTPTSHFKESADSTPFAQAGPPEKGRSDVSHMDTYETTRDGGPTSVDWQKAPPPAAAVAPAVAVTPPATVTPPAATTTSSYLDQMSSSSSSVSKPAATNTGSYLDQMSSSSSKKPRVGKKVGPTSYLDSMSSSSSRGRPTRSAVPKRGPTSYLDNMSKATAASNKRGLSSYLDQVSKTPTTPIDWSQAKSSSSSTGSMPPPAATTTTRPQGSMPSPARRTVGGGQGSMPPPASRGTAKPRATSPYVDRMAPKPTKKLAIDWALAKARQAANSKMASSSPAAAAAAAAATTRPPTTTAAAAAVPVRKGIKPDPLHSRKGPVQANPRAHPQRPTRRIAAWPKGTRPSRQVAAAAAPQKPMAATTGTPRPTRTMATRPATPTLPVRPSPNVRATRTTSPARPTRSASPVTNNTARSTRKMPIRPSRPVPKRATKPTGAAASYLESMSSSAPAQPTRPATPAAAARRRQPQAPPKQKGSGSTLPRSPYQPNPNAADSSRRRPATPQAPQQKGASKKARPNFEWMF